MTTVKDFSVKFGRAPDLGLEGQKAFPFIYTFVNANDDQWQPNLAINTDAEAMANLASIGPVVPASTTRIVNVLLDPDYNFKLLAIKYTAYKQITGDGFTTYYWYLDPNATQGAGGLSEGVDAGMDIAGTPLTHYISMSLFFQGSGSKALYGGIDAGPMFGQRVPLPVELVQGYDYGFLTTRTPYLLPRQGNLVFEITNSNPNFDIVVGAAIYGMKIRM